MIVSCPQCDTSFSMPDELYKPGRKARCSQCSNVFRLPEVQAAAEEDSAGIVIEPPTEAAPPPKKEKRSLRDISFGQQKKQTLIFLLVIVICLAGIGYGGMMVYRAVFSSTPTVSSGEGGAASEDAASAEKQRLLQEQQARISKIALVNVRQFIADNDHMKHIVVIQGEAVNEFPKPKEFIRVEAILYDAEKNVLARSEQMAGPSLTIFQLKVLTEKEMQAALNNRIAVLTNNVDVPTNGHVPFVIVFNSVPAGLKSFEVRVVDAQDSTIEEK